MNKGDIVQNRYQIEGVLGQGSMGTTYKALDLETQHSVAVKLLHFSRVQEWKALEMFEREVKILQQLEHPQIPSYIDYFSEETTADMQFALVQEYIEGKTLQQLVEEGWRGSEQEIFDILLQLVKILSYLHTLHPPVIHRDINPKNIILSSVNEVYLVDFGAVQEKIRTTFLGGSTIVGTYGYVPFEQFSGRAGPASDYYAVGATLLYLLSHRHPGDFPTEDMKPQFHDVLQTSPKVVRLLDGLLEPSAKQRIASPDQVRAILEDAPVTQAYTPSSPRNQEIHKPPWTKIERVVVKEHHLRFRIPKKVIGFIPGQALLDLTPKRVKFQDAYQIGTKIGKSWSISTADIRPSHVTWHFEKEQPVLGINYGGNTLIISSTLALAEVEWLIREIREYLVIFQGSTLPENMRGRRDQGTGSATVPAKPSGTTIKALVKKEGQITFHVPRRLISPNSKLGSLLKKDILALMSSLLGKRVVEVTPAWIQVSNEYFGIKLGKLRHVPTTAIRRSDVNWYFRKISSDPPMQRLVVGINYAGSTLEIGSHLTQEEAEWLIHEISWYLVQTKD